MPTLNAAATLERALASARDGVDEMVVADGDSEDGTPDLAARLGARVVRAPRGRGPQLAAGAAAARGDWLLFLHADTVLEPGWREAAEAHRTAGDERAACFRLLLDDPSPAARRVEQLANWRADRLGLPYGDQGLLLSRRLYESVGGFRPLPLMEDVDLARRLGRGRIVRLEAAAVTSAARYRRDGWWLRPARNLLCLTGCLLGLPPRLLARLYG